MGARQWHFHQLLCRCCVVSGKEGTKEGGARSEGYGAVLGRCLDRPVSGPLYARISLLRGHLGPEGRRATVEMKSCRVAADR